MKKKFEKGQLVERVRDNERVVGRVVEHTILAGELYVVLEHNQPFKQTSIWPVTSLKPITLSQETLCHYQQSTQSSPLLSLSLVRLQPTERFSMKRWRHKKKVIVEKKHDNNTVVGNKEIVILIEETEHKIVVQWRRCEIHYPKRDYKYSIVSD